MSRLQARFAELAARRRKALITYLTAGDPHREWTVPLLQTLVAAGADVLELGVPFSDPMADGPVIQAACERALREHVNLHEVLRMVTRFREHDAATPVVLMGYLNPVEVLGYQAFAREAAVAGVDGVLIVDLPPEESEALHGALLEQGLDPVFLASPTTPDSRLEVICRAARGFIYYVSLKGTTGTGRIDRDQVAGNVQRLRRFTGLPVGVGFGISDAASAAAIAAVADAVVVGSALVSRVAAHSDSREALERSLSELVGDMRNAVDAVGAAP